MLNVARLRVLKEVAYRGSFSAAAEALSYTQSAVSQQIATLEAETGVALLERHPRGGSLGRASPCWGAIRAGSAGRRGARRWSATPRGSSRDSTPPRARSPRSRA